MNILLEANDMVYGDRAKKTAEYGPFSEGMAKAAAMANLMGSNVSAGDVFNVMIALKLTRNSYKYKEDNLLDACAYISGLNDYSNGE